MARGSRKVRVEAHDDLLRFTEALVEWVVDPYVSTSSNPANVLLNA